MKIPLTFLSLSVLASATPGDQRIEWWNESNSRQDTLIPVSDISKPSLIVGQAGNNKPVSANLGTGLVHDTTGKLLNVDFTGYATTASLSGYVATTDFTWTNLGGKPALFSGAYADLTGKPTLFDGQYSSLSGVPSTFTPAAHTHAWSDIISGKPTTLSGYGITDGVTASGLSSTLSGYATTSALTSGLAGKLDTGSFTWSGLGGKPTTVSGFGLSDAVSTSGSYANPVWITSLAWSKVTGTPAFITGISSSDVTTALGYTPYNGTTNPSGFLTGITSGQVTGALGFTPYNATNPSGYVNQAGARSSISLTTTGTGAATYNNSTGVLNIPTPSIPSVTQNDNVSRSLNTNYTVSASQRARLYYSVNISWNIAALLSGSGAAFLEYSTNSGSSWTIISQASKSIGLLTFAGGDDLNLNGEVPANALVRIRTTSTNMTVSYVRGQEVIQ